jgi:hypothetical protein
MADGAKPEGDVYLNRRVDTDMVRDAVRQKLPDAGAPAAVFISAKDWDAPFFDIDALDYQGLYAKIKEYLLSHERMNPAEAEASIEMSLNHGLSYFIPATNRMLVAVPF